LGEEFVVLACGVKRMRGGNADRREFIVFFDNHSLVFFDRCYYLLKA
jgi:hypothetical protein